MNYLKFSLKYKKTFFVIVTLISVVEIFGHYSTSIIPAVKTRYTYWQKGIQEWKGEDLYGLSRNMCSQDSPCVCMALIHGMADESITWKKLLTYDYKDWTVKPHLVALDLSGTNKSPPPDSLDEYRVTHQADTIINALKVVESCQKWTIVGNSFGGFIATWVAFKWPESVQNLILIDSSGMKEMFQRRDSILASEPTVESLKEFQAKAYFKPRPLSDDIWEKAFERIKNGNSKKVWEAQREEDALEKFLPLIKIPTLVFWGQEDRVILPEVGRELARKIPQAQYIEIPQCGHLPQKECPQALLSAMKAFLKY